MTLFASWWNESICLLMWEPSYYRIYLSFPYHNCDWTACSSDVLIRLHEQSNTPLENGTARVHPSQWLFWLSSLSRHARSYTCQTQHWNHRCNSGVAHGRWQWHIRSNHLEVPLFDEGSMEAKQSSPPLEFRLSLFSFTISSPFLKSSSFSSISSKPYNYFTWFFYLL